MLIYPKKQTNRSMGNTVQQAKMRVSIAGEKLMSGSHLYDFTAGLF